MDHSEQYPTTMTVLLVEPQQHPRAITMDTGLKALQQAVGGYIQCVYPFEDPVGIICNEEGKLDGLPMNRALRDEDGQVYDVIAGNFLVVGLAGENFGSLSPELLEKYQQHFHRPEIFLPTGRGFMAIPISDEAVKRSSEAKMAAKKPPELPSR